MKHTDRLQNAELARSLRVIRQSLTDAKAGKVKPAKVFLEELAARQMLNSVSERRIFNQGIQSLNTGLDERT
jgi:hypothetical protein